MFVAAFVCYRQMCDIIQEQGVKSEAKCKNNNR